MGKYWVLFFLCNIGWLQAQLADDFITKSLKDNDITQQIPPLDSLVQKAIRYSAKLKLFDTDIQTLTIKEKETRTQLLRFLAMGASYNYGIFDNLNNQQLAGDPSANLTLISTEQTRYNLGVSLSIPLEAILNRGKQIKTARLEKEKAIFSKQMIENEIEEIVMLRYNSFVKAHKFFLIASAVLDTYRVQAKQVEKDYANGIIGISEYTRLNQILNDAIRGKESAAMDYRLNLRYLETIIGEKLSISS